jgi:excisionase family DNA binding protein
MSIGEAASCLGVAVPTLRRWHRDGRLCPKFRTPGGHRRYDAGDVARLAGTQPAGRAHLKTIAYARVSSHDQKADLTRQADRLHQHCLGAGHANIEVIQDLGSGLNYNKRGLRRLLRLICHGRVERLVVTHKDRLLRFGAELVFSLCCLFGVDVVVLDDDPGQAFEQQLAADVIALMTVFSARMHGRRAHARRSAAAMSA